MVHITQKRLLVTGGSHAELPLIEAAKRKGYFVITTGNNTDGIGHKYADKYVPADFSDKELVVRLAEQENVSAIVSGCNDFAYLSTAYACERLGLPGHDSYQTAVTLHHKDCFRHLAKSLGIRTPKVHECTSEADMVNACNRLGFPIVIKPTDLTGGKGVKTCQSEQEALSAYREAKAVTRKSVVLAEERINGSNHGASVILKNQKIVFGFCDNEQYYLNPYLVSGACAPSEISQRTRAQLFSDIEKIAGKLGLTDGIFHTQFIVEQDGTAVLIDPCRRAPGDLYILLVKYSTEVDYPAVIVGAECGEAVAETYPLAYHNIARECIMASRNGTLQSVKIDETIQKCVFDQLIWAKEQDVIEDYLKYKAGILFFECENETELYDKVEKFHELVRVDVS